MNDEQTEMLRKCFQKWNDNQWDGDDCMTKLAGVFEELANDGLRTYTIRLSYDVTVQAHDELEANALAYHWFSRVMEKGVDDVELPENVFSVQTMPQRHTVFVGSPKVVTS